MTDSGLHGKAIECLPVQPGQQALAEYELISNFNRRRL